MAGGQAMDGKTFACYGIFLPVQFGNILFPEPPRFKMLSDSQRANYFADTSFQSFYSLIIQMVPMVVRDDE